MEIKANDFITKIFLNTGNILSLHDITKKPGQNPTEEVCFICNMSHSFYNHNVLLLFYSLLRQ